MSVRIGRVREDRRRTKPYVFKVYDGKGGYTPFDYDSREEAVHKHRVCHRFFKAAGLKVYGSRPGEYIERGSVVPRLVAR